MYNLIATRGNQGAHTYFTAAMQWGELDHLLVFPEDIADLDEDQQMQRAYAKKRIGDLVSYLDEKDHFFSALTLVILPRDMRRAATDEKTNPGGPDYHFAPFAEGSIPFSSQEIGQLSLSGQVRLFPADGQHRSRAALQKLQQDAGFATEEVPVVLIPFESHDQVRQLFADLNLNAKPVSKATGLDFEARDPLVMVVKHAAERVPMFEDENRINRRSNSLPKTSAAVITLSTLKEGSQEILAALAACEGNTLSAKNSDDRVTAYIRDREKATQALADVWRTITDLFPEQRDQILNGERTPGEIREDYLFAFGLGQRGLARAAATLIEKRPDDWDELLESAANELDWHRGADEWKGNAVIHGTDKDGTPTYRVNNTGPAIQNLAKTIVDKALLHA